LNDERQIAFVELFKPVIPGDLFERALSGIAWEIEANHTDIVRASGAPHAGRLGVAVLCPAANLIVISQRFGRC
jgi:hypothetical protein